jgi:hypothetical protein
MAQRPLCLAGAGPSQPQCEEPGPLQTANPVRGPMICASIVAMDHELDPPRVTLMVGVGIPLSFLTLPVWWHVLQSI